MMGINESRDVIKGMQNFPEDVVNTLIESILVLDADLRVVYANRSFYKTFRVSRKGTEQALIYELGNGQWDIPRLRELLEDILPKKIFFEGYEVEHNFPGIGHKVMLINARKLKDFENDPLILVAIQDITQQKKALQYLVQSGKLSAIGQLSAGIAHGLNSPLTGIQNFLKVYLKESVEGSERYQELKLMLEGCEYMSAVIKNMTYFAGDFKEEFRLIGVDEVIDPVMFLTERQLMTHNIKIVKDIPKDLNKINGNKGQLEHAILNIIINAQEAIKDNGEIAVKARNLEGTGVRLEIADTGEGILKKDLPRIFEPFFTTKRNQGGTGLGLSAAYGIVKQHKGTISVESSKGEGTKVIIILPASEEKGG